MLNEHVKIILKEMAKERIADIQYIWYYGDVLKRLWLRTCFFMEYSPLEAVNLVSKVLGKEVKDCETVEDAWKEVAGIYTLVNCDEADEDELEFLKRLELQFPYPETILEQANALRLFVRDVTVNWGKQTISVYVQDDIYSKLKFAFGDKLADWILLREREVSYVTNPDEECYTNNITIAWQYPNDATLNHTHIYLRQHDFLGNEYREPVVEIHNLPDCKVNIS